LVEVDWLQQVQWLGTLVLAGVLGAVIGAEREITDKPAGLRTHVFICIAAALFVIVGRVAMKAYAEGAASDGASTGGVIADPTRIVHAVVLGISFLGAGTIIQESGRNGGQRVAGLTTAASVWLVTALGITVAMNLWVLAVCVTALALAVLVGLRYVERWLRRHWQRDG
jgi:putative Mg2+ transporter-C (MgtC) family protein